MDTQNDTTVLGARPGRGDRRMSLRRWMRRNDDTRRNSRSERGSVLVEAAMVLPLLLMITMGAVDYGVMINRSTLANNAAREGAREAVLGGTAADIEARVRAAAVDLDQAALTVTVTCEAEDGTPCGGSYDANHEPGGAVIVTVDYTHQFLTPITGMLGMGTTHDLSSEVVMRIEA